MDWEEKELHQHQWHRAEEPPQQKGKSLSFLLLALRGLKGRWRRWAGTTVPCSSSSWAVDSFAEEEEHWWHWGVRGSVLLQPPGRSEQRSECSRAGSPVLGWTTVSEGMAAGRGAILYLHFKWVFHVKLIYMYVYVCVYINNVNFRIGSNAYTGLKFAW